MRLTTRTRPIQYPMATPSVIASANASTTRASVAPRFRKSAPDLASAVNAARTAGGAGSLSLSTSRAATHQVARKTASDNRRIASVSGCRAIEGIRIKLRRWPDQLTAANFSQHMVERSRVGLLLGDGTPRNAFAVAVSIRVQGCLVGGSGQGLDLLPLAVGG